MARTLSYFERVEKTTTVTFELVTACFEVLREYRKSPFLRMFSKKRQKALAEARDIFDSKLCYASEWYSSYATDGKAKTNLHGMLGFADTIYKLVM